MSTTKIKESRLKSELIKFYLTKKLDRPGEEVKQDLLSLMNGDVLACNVFMQDAKGEADMIAKETDSLDLETPIQSAPQSKRVSSAPKPKRATKKSEYYSEKLDCFLRISADRTRCDIIGLKWNDNPPKSASGVSLVHVATGKPVPCGDKHIAVTVLEYVNKK